MPKVSIVLPVYNGMKFIRESVGSIMVQSFRDWELILVDDCSSDGTADILDEYALMDNRISVIHNPVNRKLPQSLNIGFAMAQGEYLTWTSDDNCYLPSALEVMAEYLDHNRETVMVRSNFYFINEHGEFIAKSPIYSNRDMYVYNCLGACFLYRRQVLYEVGEYNTDCFGVEDYDYWLRILDKYKNIDSIKEELYEYRRHSCSLSITKRQMVLDQLVRLRDSYQKKIFYILKEKKAELCRMYYEMLAANTFSEEFRSQFRTQIPELQGDLGFTCRKPFIIFGAGNYGGRAGKILGDQALFFTDNDTSKIGKEREGKKIISFEQALKLSDQCDFFVAVSGKHIYEILKQLIENKVREFTVMQCYMLSKGRI